MRGLGMKVKGDAEEEGAGRGRTRKGGQGLTLSEETLGATKRGILWDRTDSL